jgi:ELWxxDGT repeat protein
VKDIAHGRQDSSPRRLTAVGERVFFEAYDDPTETWSLWVSDGTNDGTVLVRQGRGDAYSAVAGRLMFSADDGNAGPEPWVSDGTPEGTLMVADLNPDRGSYPTSFVAQGSDVLFQADDGEHGPEPWLLPMP